MAAQLHPCLGIKAGDAVVAPAVIGLKREAEGAPQLRAHHRLARAFLILMEVAAPIFEDGAAPCQGVAEETQGRPQARAAVIAKGEGATAVAVGMEIEVETQAFLSPVRRLTGALSSENGRVLGAPRPAIHPIQVRAVRVLSVMPAKHAVGVKHRHYKDDVAFQEGCGVEPRHKPNQGVEDALEDEAGGGLSRVYTGAHEDGLAAREDVWSPRGRSRAAQPRDGGMPGTVLGLARSVGDCEELDGPSLQRICEVLAMDVVPLLPHAVHELVDCCVDTPEGIRVAEGEKELLPLSDLPDGVAED
mmetsp:Transcript_34568/g.75183  ORF Transcript_34568/g.75183 Transcript_34568/m.75183 type:complete len:303 (-) Transcript_34568:1109-2017(-)